MCSVRKDTFRNFAKFTRKHLCRAAGGLKIGILGNIRKISNLSGDIAQRPVPLTPQKSNPANSCQKARKCRYQAL